jgi:GMP synthase-like glutamine amidotransferase
VKVHVLQHAPFEGLGSIAAWLSEHHAAVSVTRLFAGGPLPSADAFELLIAMGGPMSVNDEDALPWLRSEKQLVRDAVTAGRRVLGVCLGAQLIASALGARVFRNRVKEIGWFPVQAVPSPPDTFRFPAELEVFHWHGETFDLPPGAVRLARSEGCEQQAFQIGRNVLGLQFHLETTPESVDAMLENGRDDLTPGPFVQAEPEIRTAPAARYAATHAVAQDVLAYLFR